MNPNLSKHHISDVAGTLPHPFTYRLESGNIIKIFRLTSIDGITDDKDSAPLIIGEYGNTGILLSLTSDNASDLPNKISFTPDINQDYYVGRFYRDGHDLVKIIQTPHQLIILYLREDSGEDVQTKVKKEIILRKLS